MDQSVIKKLLDLGFEQRMENVYSIVAENKLFATMNYWEIFVCFEMENISFQTMAIWLRILMLQTLCLMKLWKTLKKEFQNSDVFWMFQELLKNLNQKILIRHFHNLLKLWMLLTKCMKNCNQNKRKVAYDWKI